MYSNSSAPVRRSGRESPSIMSPRAPSTCPRWVFASNPATETDPASGVSSPAIIASVVDFPAPFGPTTPNQLPTGMERSIESTATPSPKRLVSPVSWTAEEALSVMSALSSGTRRATPGRRRGWGRLSRGRDFQRPPINVSTQHPGGQPVTVGRRATLDPPPLPEKQLRQSFPQRIATLNKSYFISRIPPTCPQPPSIPFSA